jgi:hypothetical protein
MSRKLKITRELSVGLSQELDALLQFACENTQLNPSLFGRVAISEKLSRDGWMQRAASLVGRKDNVSA